MLVPDRRTVTVLATLIGAMTVASGLLLLLEPRPSTIISNISLSTVNHETPSEASGEGSVLDDQAQAGRWSAIVIHYGGADENIDARYHFVIPSKRRGGGDPIVANPRWQRQQPGAYWAGSEGDWVNHHAVGIRLSQNGNADGPSQKQLRTLVQLVQRLQSRFQIPADRVILQADNETASHGDGWFPVAWLRHQLLTFATP